MEKGDRIQLLSMGGDEPCPIPSGATGTVTRTLHDFGDGSTQVSVEWDPPNETRSLSLVCPPDRALVLTVAQARPGEGLSISDEVREALRGVLDRVADDRDLYADGYRAAIRDVLSGRFWS